MTDGVDGADWMRVPDAVRQPVLPVAPPPDWIDGFRFARTADGLNEDANIDEALTRMLRGIRCEQLSEVGL